MWKADHFNSQNSSSPSGRDMRSFALSASLSSRESKKPRSTAWNAWGIVTNVQSQREIRMIRIGISLALNQLGIPVFKATQTRDVTYTWSPAIPDAGRPWHLRRQFCLAVVQGEFRRAFVETRNRRPGILRDRRRRRRDKYRDRGRRGSIDPRTRAVEFGIHPVEKEMDGGYIFRDGRSRLKRDRRIEIW